MIDNCNLSRLGILRKFKDAIRSNQWKFAKTEAGTESRFERLDLAIITFTVVVSQIAVIGGISVLASDFTTADLNLRILSWTWISQRNVLYQDLCGEICPIPLRFNSVNGMPLTCGKFWITDWLTSVRRD